MRVAIHQPNYAPWCGYFAKMKICDVFVFLDDVQMLKQSYISRCRVRSSSAVDLLSIPCRRFHTGELIRDIVFANNEWPRHHLSKMQSYYAHAPYWKEVSALIEPVYADAGDSLSGFNMRLSMALADYLGIRCEFVVSSNLDHEGARDDRNLSICKTLGADTYISGKGGQKYQDPRRFDEANVQLEVCEYIPVQYSQIHGEFVPGLSILDAVSNLGKNAADVLVYSGASAADIAASPDEQ